MSAAGLRGRTRPGRLALLDRLLLTRERELLARSDGPFARAVFVDVGLGDAPDTTFESARAFRELAPALRTLGVDIDPVRVAHARPCHVNPSRTSGFSRTYLASSQAGMKPYPSTGP